jgi:heme-degrading monooxygenase HmoA
VIIFPAADRPDVFAINVFHVRSDSQQQFIDCIRDAGDPADIPGLLSMHLLRGKDGTQVINHMHWATKEALDRAGRDNPVIARTRTAIRQYIDGPGPAPYEVVEIKARD